MRTDDLDHPDFLLLQEFPEFRDLHAFASVEAPRTYKQVFDEFMAHNEARMAKTDLAFATVESYRKILESTWRPAIGELILRRGEVFDVGQDH